MIPQMGHPEDGGTALWSRMPPGLGQKQLRQRHKAELLASRIVYS